MIPCSGFIEEVQNVRTSTKVLYSTNEVHVLPPSVEFWKLRFIKNQIYPFTFKYSHIALIIFQIKQ